MTNQYRKPFNETVDPVRIKPVMTTRQKNRAGERTMSFVDNNGNRVNAVMLVGLDGLPIDMTATAEKLDLVYEELQKLNLQLSMITGSEI